MFHQISEKNVVPRTVAINNSLASISEKNVLHRLMHNKDTTQLNIVSTT